MTYYYHHGQPMYQSFMVVSRTTTIFGMVSQRIEFWFFLLLHVVLVTGIKLGVLPVSDDLKFRWELVAPMQFFMTFFLTFYNGHCYARYTYMYDRCMEVVDNVLFFVQELVVSLPHPELEKHRVAATKYALAMTYVFFFSTTGGALSKPAWREIVRKGLLTKAEAEKLSDFPGRAHEAILVLSCWAMQILDQALQHDLMWQERSMRTAHTHNRANSYIIGAVDACHKIASTLGLPMPFPYFHLMNVVLLFTAFVVAAVSALLFQSYMTIMPFSVALLFFLGLRDISTALADPFGTDDVDFPIAAFIEYTFDNAVVLLEAFSAPAAVDIVPTLESVQEFTDKQLRKQTKAKNLYKKTYDPATSNPFAWSKEMPLQALLGAAEGPALALRKLLLPPQVAQGNAEEEGTAPAAVNDAAAARYVLDDDASDSEDDEELSDLVLCIRAMSACAVKFLLCCMAGPCCMICTLIRGKPPEDDLDDGQGGTRLQDLTAECEERRLENEKLERLAKTLRQKKAFLLEKASCRADLAHVKDGDNKTDIAGQARAQVSNVPLEFNDFHEASLHVRKMLRSGPDLALGPDSSHADAQSQPGQQSAAT